MRNRVRQSLLALAAAGMVVAQALVSAQAGTAAAALVTRTAMKGEAVFVNFDVVDGCHRTLVTVFGNVNRTKEATPNDQLASVSLFKIDTCEPRILVEGFGTTPSLALDVNRELSQASLEATVNFTDIANGKVLPVVVDLDFTATAKAVKTNTHDRFESENIIFTTSAKSSVRRAAASGSVLLDGVELLPQGETSFDAVIASGTERAVTIERRVTP